MPRAVGDIAWLAREGRRARYDYVEERNGGERGQEVRAHRRETGTMAVCPRVLGRRQCRVRVYVDRCDVRRPGPGGRESEDPGPRPNVRNPLATQIEPADEGCKEFAGDEAARVKDGRSDDEPKTRRPSYPRRAPFQD